jgi:hypothetical protein
VILAIGHGPWQLTVYVLFATLAVTVVMLGTGSIATLRDRTKERPPEGRLYRWDKPDQAAKAYTTALEAYLQKAGPEGPALYRHSVIQDIPFLALYGAGLVLLIDGTFGRAFGDPGSVWRYVLDAIGVAAAVADGFEDISLWRAVKSDGTVDPQAVRAASLFTLLKWTLILLAFAVVVAGAVVIGLRGSGTF